MAATHITSCKNYYVYLKYDLGGTEEAVSLIDAVTVNETYFFREMPQLLAFRDEVLPQLTARREAEGKRVLTLWIPPGSSES
jgi:chemotaxis protein methyltransferase CheR